MMLENQLMDFLRIQIWHIVYLKQMPLHLIGLYSEIIWK